MTNKFLIVSLLLFTFYISSCTSSQSQDETQTIENADVDKIDAENSAALSEGLNDETQAEDASLQTALGEPSVQASSESIASVEQSDTATPLEQTIADDVAAAPTLDASSLDAATPVPENTSANPPPLDMSTTSATTDTAASDDINVAAGATALAEAPNLESSRTDEPVVAAVTDSIPVKKVGGELKKVAETIPYKVASGWVNTVYVARPNETLKEISQKIYSSDKTKELKKISGNSFFKNRSVRAGDKIYYVSPNRPEDSEKTLVYYEDMGMVAETYVAKKGDNLKKVAKEILGYDKAYIEMWTANPVESKTKLNEGETLRFWRSASGVTSAASVATASAPVNSSAQLMDHNQLPPPPPQPTEAAMPAPTVDPAFAPPQNAAVNNYAESLPPPPPPPTDDLALPPPPVDDLAMAPKKKKHIAVEEEASDSMGALDNDTMMSLGAVGILTAALAFLMIRRKKKKATEASAMANESQFGS